MTASIAGVYVPVLTPFAADLALDQARFTRFCRWLLSQNAGLAVFGTNSEANSVSAGERRRAIDALLEAGVPAARLMPGTGACAVTEAIELTQHAVKAGACGVLMLPPWYYKGVSDDGLEDYYSRVIDAVASDRLQVLLYHIPQVSGVPISHALIERLMKKYPRTVVGIKDSSGDWNNCEAMLKRFPGFKIFPASESFLARALPLGAAGCISATANIQPGAIARHIAEWRGPGMEDRHKQVDAVRGIMQKTNMIPALKYVTAHFARDAEWQRVRPPLDRMDDATGQPIVAALGRVGFDMPGWK